MRKTRVYHTGLALSVILLVAALLAAIAISIALAQRTTSSAANQERAHLAATAVINTAQNIKMGIDGGMANSIGIAALTFDNAAGTGIFNPDVGGPVMQMLVPYATTDITRRYWVYHGASALVKLKNVGSGAGSYVLELDPITQATCQEINAMLYNDPTIPSLSIASVSSWWANSGPNAYGATASTPVDASTDNAVNGRPEGCVYAPSSPKYLYYKSVLDN